MARKYNSKSLSAKKIRRSLKEGPIYLDELIYKVTEVITSALPQKPPIIKTIEQSKLEKILNNNKSFQIIGEEIETSRVCLRYIDAPDENTDENLKLLVSKFTTDEWDYLFKRKVYHKSIYPEPYSTESRFVQRVLDLGSELGHIE